jgi:hypothetical protein
VSDLHSFAREFATVRDRGGWVSLTRARQMHAALRRAAHGMARLVRNLVAPAATSALSPSSGASSRAASSMSGLRSSVGVLPITASVAMRSSVSLASIASSTNKLMQSSIAVPRVLTPRSAPARRGLVRFEIDVRDIALVLPPVCRHARTYCSVADRCVVECAGRRISAILCAHRSRRSAQSLRQCSRYISVLACTHADDVV